MTDKSSPNIQDVFLNYVRREKLTVTIRMMDGSELDGRIKNFDRFAVIIEQGGVDHMLFKHAIAAIKTPEVSLELLLATSSAWPSPFTSAIVIVLDSVGIGELPDALGVRRPGQQHARQHRAAGPAGRADAAPTWTWIASSTSAAVGDRSAPARRDRTHGGGVGREGFRHRPLGDDGDRA